MTGENGVWVYAVSARMAPEWFSGISGVGDGTVTTVDGDGLAAAVSAVSLAEFGEQALRRHLEDLGWLEAAARGHHRVIEAAARHGPVIPLRLATVYQSPAGVEHLLRDRRENFLEAIGRVTARSEWGVKVYAADPGSRSAGTPASPGPAGSGPAGSGPVASGTPGSGTAGSGTAASGRPGTAYLRRRQQQLSSAQEAKRSAAASAERVHTALSPLAAASLLRAPQDPHLTGRSEQMVLNATYLVDDSTSAGFTATVAGLAERHHGIRIELTGPWPPYSFSAAGEEITGGEGLPGGAGPPGDRAAGLGGGGGFADGGEAAG